jgi:alkylated DNA repair dioxygenase AlkB
MNGDLFSREDEFEQILLPEAFLLFAHRIALPDDDIKILARLIDETPWRKEKIVVWGKSHDQPRLIAWYGDEDRNYAYSGIKMSPLPWSPLLRSLLEVVENLTGERFNSALLNYYRDERDSMGFHSDDERELGSAPTIASLSFGQERTLVFKHKTRKSKPVKLLLSSGSLLIMKGPTQANWTHGIEKGSVPMGARVNLTFRKILD